MAFNFAQIFILFGLLLGVICVSILFVSKSLQRISNFYLAVLISCFIANVGQYWLKDVGLLSKAQMELIFIPWQMLVAPFFLLYVYSLRIFNYYPFRKWILFAPFFLTMLVHILVKGLILNEGLDHWSRVPWVSAFYLIEELLSLLYCLFSAVIVFRWIWLEKQGSNYKGFGVNKELVRWIKVMLQMGLVLALIWTISLYFVRTSSTSAGSYYLLWCVMVVVLNILGFTGIFYSLKSGEFSRIALLGNSSSRASKMPSGFDFTISTPIKYLDDISVNSLFDLTSKFASATSSDALEKHLRSWFKSKFSVEADDVVIKSSSSILSEKKEGMAVIPIKGSGGNNEYLQINLGEDASMGEADYYLMNMAAQAIGFYKDRLESKSSRNPSRENHKVYLAMVNLLEDDEVYTNPQMDLTMLARKLDVSSGYLSKIINDAGNKNFTEIINDYRIRKVKKIMSDQSYRHYTIVAYGLEAGFNSKSTFYKAFQKREGISPGKYLEEKHSAR